MPENTEKTPLRRATDHKFKKRFILIPVGILVFTVVGFLALRTTEKIAVPATETTATASVDVPSAKAGGTGVANLQNKAVSPANKAFKEAIETTATTSSTTTPTGTHFQLSLDVLKERENFKSQQQRWYVQTAFSGIMVLASLFVILSKKYPDEVNKFGYSTIAFILGYWLKGF